MQRAPHVQFQPYTHPLFSTTTVVQVAVRSKDDYPHSTHLISDIEPILNQVVFLKNGTIVLDKSVEDIKSETGSTVDALFREVFKW